MLSSRVKISCFRTKAHLVFHWCLYNKEYERFSALKIIVAVKKFEKNRLEWESNEPWQCDCELVNCEFHSNASCVLLTSNAISNVGYPVHMVSFRSSAFSAPS